VLRVFFLGPPPTPTGAHQEVARSKKKVLTVKIELILYLYSNMNSGISIQYHIWKNQVANDLTFCLRRLT
jgi:hypothetical protein